MKRYLVYFFGTDYDRVKIGRCYSNLHQRQISIQTGCPDPIKLLGVIQCQDKIEMNSIEKDLHQRFQQYQTIGEWFRLVPEILNVIQESTESGQDILESDYRAFCDRNAKQFKDRNRQYYRDNEEYRERNKQRGRERFKNDPEYRKRQNQSRRERYHSDPEYRRRKYEDKCRRRAAKRKRRPLSPQTLAIPGIE